MWINRWIESPEESAELAGVVLDVAEVVEVMLSAGELEPVETGQAGEVLVTYGPAAAIGRVALRSENSQGCRRVGYLRSVADCGHAPKHPREGARGHRGAKQFVYSSASGAI